MHRTKIMLMMIGMAALTGCTTSKYDYKVYEEMVNYLIQCDEGNLRTYSGSEFTINGTYKEQDNVSGSYLLTMTLTNPSIDMYNIKLIVGSMRFSDTYSYEYASTGFNNQSPIIFSNNSSLGSNVTNKITLSWITSTNVFNAKAYVTYKTLDGNRQNIQFKFSNFIEKV